MLIGLLLGGVLGLGTVVYALAIGPLTQLLLPRVRRRPPREEPVMTLFFSFSCSRSWPSPGSRALRELWLDQPEGDPQSAWWDPDTVPPSQRVLS